ncbi:MAG TPA: N-6 DNA methylase [Opitutaceae bacterium]|nr:N-6 DNA methylase [Opitutaceae bacterium]
MARAKSAPKSAQSSATIGFEAKLWLTADKLRNNMDAAEYKHVVLGLIFLKYISDTFEEHRAKLLAGKGDYKDADPEDPDEYKAENVFWVPPAARWAYLQSSAKQPAIGKIVDDAMVAIERDNPRLKGVLPKDYARPGLDKQRLGELIDVIATIELTAASEGEKTHRSVDLLGRVYEYFLTRFASAEGKNGGQFYTPSCVVRCLVEMLAPYKGRIYDPACGSGGMFVQSEKFVESHGGRLGDISIYGQESNATTRRLAVMNLALRGIEADFGPEHADTFRRDLHPDLRADYVLANPPFNDSDWFRKDDDVRWQFGVPPKGNANFAWVQHFILFIVGSLIKGLFDEVRAGTGHIKQIFVLTHNVYFHKEITYNPKRKDVAMNEETFWIVRKPGLVSRLAKQPTNPIKTSYELLWAEVREPERSNLAIQNTLRRILENYFKILGGIEFDDLCAMFDGKEKLICKSLCSWVHDGSHYAHDDLYVSIDDSMVDSYLKVFRAIFDKSGNSAHYKMMMADAFVEGPAAVTAPAAVPVATPSPTT